MSEEIRNLVRSRLHEIGGNVLLGESTSYNWVDDPARLLFSLSRYKFVQKMFAGYQDVLEIGCADGFGSYLVSKSVVSLKCVDIDPTLIDSAKKTTSNYSPNIEFISGDITQSSLLSGTKFDGAYMLDVLEHIPSKMEDDFIGAVTLRLKPFGSMIIGMPSLESQIYASNLSRIGHVNCKTYEQLKELCSKHFMNFFIFGANDEVVHTGFPQLAHYRLALCSSPRTHHEGSLL